MQHPRCLKCGYSLMKNGACPNHRCDNYPHPEHGVTLADMEEVYPRLTLFDGRQWGEWRLQAENLTLQHPHYEIDLENISDSAKMLDWIFQLEHKTWATEKVLADLLSAFDDIFKPQANLCSMGGSKTIEPKKFLLQRIKPAADSTGKRSRTMK